MDRIVDGLPDENREQTAVARKLLFRGSSGVQEVQAKALIQTILLAPSSTHPHMLDGVRLYGWVDFRRIRREARWVLFHRKVFDRDAGPVVERVSNLREQSD